VGGVPGESETIRIGDNLPQVPGSSACYIGGITLQSSPGGAAVFINIDGKLGTTVSSRRFKEEIKPMDKASEAILTLQPVMFRYKKELDPTGRAQFGLVAEEVEKVNPNLVIHGKDGKPDSVRYDQVNAMLLNEFLKEHQKVEDQQAAIAELTCATAEQETTIEDLKSTVAQQQQTFQSQLAKQEKQMEALALGLQKVSAQVEAGKPTLQVTSTNP
jgi:uncharacterized coiled-coil protein SlyX